MDTDWIHKMRVTKRLKLSSLNMFSHFSIVIFLLLGPLSATWYLMEYYILGNYDGVRTPFEMARILYPWIIPAIFFYIFQRKRLRFKQINTSVTTKDFKTVVELTANELEWRIDYFSDEFVRAYHTSKWSASWGEMITIIHEKDYILINSICDPNKSMYIISLGWNKKNVRMFKSKLISLTQEHL